MLFWGWIFQKEKSIEGRQQMFTSISYKTMHLYNLPNSIYWFSLSAWTALSITVEITNRHKEKKQKAGKMKIIKVLFPEKLHMPEFEEAGTYAFCLVYKAASSNENELDAGNKCLWY